MANPSASIPSWQSSNLDNPFVTTKVYLSGNLIKSSDQSPHVQKIRTLIQGNANFEDYSIPFPNLPKQKLQLFSLDTFDKCEEFQMLNEDFLYRMHKKDVVTLVRYRTNSAFVGAVIKAEREKGKNILQASQEIEEYINNKDYSSLLKLIWSDKENRLEWLRKNQVRLPPIFAYELGLSEFTHAPTIETIQQVVFPLFNAAAHRVIIDGYCLKSTKESESQSFGWSVEQTLNGIYLKCLQEAATRYFTPELKEKGLTAIDLKHMNKPTPITFKKIIEASSMFIEKGDQIASPHWLMYHAGRFIHAQAQNVDAEVAQESVLIPEHSWKLLRRKLSEQNIENIKKMKQ